MVHVPEWVTVAQASEVSAGQMVGVSVDGEQVLLANVGGEYRAIGTVCTHLQCLLHEGELDEEQGAVTCPCHGSVFDLATGEVLEPPAEEAEPVYEVRSEAGEIQVARRHS